MIEGNGPLVNQMLHDYFQTSEDFKSYVDQYGNVEFVSVLDTTEDFVVFVQYDGTGSLGKSGGLNTAALRNDILVWLWNKIK